jgi:hypothetical protein
VVGLLFATAIVDATAVLVYTGHGQTGTDAASPFRFINGANYATVNGLGFQTDTFPSAGQVSIAVAAVGVDGAAGTYDLDTIEVQTVAATASAWTLSLSVSTPIIGTGINAAYVSYCTVAPTGVNDGAAPLASSGAAGDPWSIYAPTCAGTQVNVDLLAAGVGTSIPVANGVAAGTSVMFLSLLLSVSNTGATTTTAAQISLVGVA